MAMDRIGLFPIEITHRSTTPSRTISVSVATENNDALPDGQFLPPMKMTCGETHFRERVAAKFGRTVTIGRTAILTQNHNGRVAWSLLRGVRT